MANRITYRGVALFANGEQLDRVTAFGASTTLNREDLFEMGNSGLVDVVEDASEVSMTVDSYEYGSIRTLALLAGYDPTEKTVINFSKDLEFARSDIWNMIKPTGADVPFDDDNGDVIYTEFMKNCFLNGYSANYTVDGTSTESYTLVSDNKRWLLNSHCFVHRVPLEYDGTEWTGTLSGMTTGSILKVSVDGQDAMERVSDETVTASQIAVTIANTTGDEEVYALVACNVPSKIFVPNTNKDEGAKRRGQIEIYLVKDYTHDGGLMTYQQSNAIQQFKVQSVSVDVTLNREDLAQLGTKYFYDRPLVLPIDVSVSFDLTFGELDMFAQFCGKDIKTATELDVDSIVNDLGLVVRVYDKEDIDTDRVAKKELHIPKLVPTDEAFNISLDGNATQTFSFRSHELAVKQL